MKENKINFSNFNLVVDFLRFNLQFTEKSKIQQVAQYLFDEYWCATFLKDSHTGKFYPIRKNRQFRCKAKFITSHTSHWCGTRLEFDGMSASIFYQMIKDKPLDWKRMDLDSTNIGRIDLYYDRHFQETDRGEDYDKFLTETHAILSSRQPSLKVESKSQSLAIGDRKTSPNYFRIYKKSNGRSIRFELEIKLKLAKNFQFFLFAGQFETLELKLVQHYYSYLITKFEIQRSSYTNWILENFRNIRLLQTPQDSLVTTYLTNKFDSRLTDQEFLYRLFQLLSYIRQLDYSVDTIGDQEYLILSFKFTDFLQFTDNPQNVYQVQKVGKFLKSLQSLPPILTAISNLCFQSINIFPYIKVFRKVSWYVEFAIAEELYFYNYPFYFPKAFLNYQNKYQLQAQLAFLLAFSVKEVRKVLNVEEFLDRFNLSNSNLRQVRSYLLQTFLLAQDSQLIENQFILVLKTNTEKTVSQLTTNQIGRTKLIYFYEKITSKN